MKFQLKILLDGQASLIPLDGLKPSVGVPEGAVFTLVDEQGNPVTEGVVLKRDGEELEIEVDGEQVAVIENFYTAEASQSTYLVDGTEEGVSISGGESTATTEGVVWEAAESATDDTFLGMSPLTASLVGAGIVAGGVYAGTSSSNSGSSPAVDPAPQSYQVSVNPVAGEFTSSVLVELYDDTGTVVGSKVHDMSTGPATFDITNGYAGTLLAKISDANGASGDYLDEATNTMQSLDTPLRVMLKADGTSDVTSTVTPLTELATRLAGVSDTTPTVSTDDLTVNDKIADMFGLEDITSDVVTVVDSSFNEADGITASEAYGKVLALLSGADSNSGNIDNTLDILATEIVETASGDLGITANGFEVLSDGATAFESGVNASTAELTADLIVDAPHLEGGENWLSSSEAQSSPTIKVSDAAVGDTVVIHWGDQQFSTTLTSSDIDSNGVASIQVPSSVITAEGNGQVEVQSQINGGQISNTLLVDVDTSSPTFVSGTTATLDENEPASTVLYTANVSDVDQVTFTLTGTDASLLSVNGTTGEVTLNASANHEVKSTYDFALVATDEAGNATTQAVVLTINNLDEVAPTLTSSSVATAVDENTSVSTVIYTATADDSADISGGYTFALRGTDSELLNINSATGEVTLKAQADYESKSTYNFEVVSTDAAGNESAPYAVTLDINNLDEAAPFFQKGSSITVSVDENSPLGTVIHTANALDSADISNGVTYALVSGASNFDIDSSTGEVTTKITLDHETTHSYTFEIEATDAAGNKVSQTVTLQLNDIDDATPTITSGLTGSVDENAASSTVIYTATADDSADISGGLIFSVQGVDAALLNIDSSTGEVTLKASGDHETKSSYDFEVVATDLEGNASAPQAVTVTVNNLDEVGPTITSIATASVNENAATSTVIYTATADDSADISGGFTFSIQGDDAALFDINAVTGDVTLKSSADQEAKSTYNIEIVATDAAGNESAPHSVVVTVGDLDEVAPSISSSATGSVAENAAISTVVYTATADDSADISGGVTFSLLGTDAAMLDINATTGEVTLKVSADHESKSSYDFEVVATDVAGNVSAPHSVLVSVTDLDEATPTISSSSTGSVDENAVTSTVIYTATADDSADFSGGVTFAVLGADAALLDINAATGEVTLKTSADHESKTSYEFQVTATDAAGHVSTPHNVSVSVVDLDEAVPTITSGSVGSVDENQVTSTVVYTATADDSGDLSGGVSFSLQGADAALLNVDSVTGEVTLKAAADYETKTSYAFEVVATDAAGNASVGHAVTITVNDLDEIEPAITSGSTGSVTENAATSTVVYTATADDSADISGGVIFSLQGADSAMFDINASTGEVTLKATADHETKSSYDISVVATDNAGNVGTPKVVTITVVDQDEVAPTITSASSVSLDENAATSTVVYTATADDSGDVSGGLTFALQGTDAALFDVNVTTGEVTLKASADHEVKASYDFEVVATDNAGNASAPQTVTLTVNDLDEATPTITSGGTGSVDENLATSTVVYTATADDSGDVSGGLTFALQGTDAALFDINSSTGEVTLKAPADHEVKSSYDFAVVATDAAGNASGPQAVTITVNDIDDSAPTVTSGATGSVDENAVISTVVYTATADDSADISGGVTFSLQGTDASLFDINGTTGEVTLKASADHETKASYDFEVVATDAAGNSSAAQAVTITVNDLDEVQPAITSGSTGSVDENALTSTVVYTAIADDSGDISGGVTYSIQGTDAAMFDINATTGEVTLKASADHEVKASYDFEVFAIDNAGNVGTAKPVTISVTDLDETNPTITSGAASSVDENADTSTVVYTATADDSADISDGVVFSLQGTDAALFDINASSGEVTLKASADHESKATYDIEIVSTDNAGNASAPHAVTITINDLDDAVPTITSGATGSVDENAATSTVVYTVTADDSADVSGGVTYSLQGVDSSLFDINGSTGEVTLKASADYEAKSSYDIEVVATDAAGNASAPQAVTISVDNIDDATPTITSGSAGSVDENAVNSTVVYTAVADDSVDTSGGVSFSLGGTDAALLSINSSNGEVTLNTSADYEAQSTYSFYIIADDGQTTPAIKAVVVTVNDLDEVAPTVTSGGTGSVNENAVTATVVYTATADDSTDISGGVTFGLQGTDAALFDINASTGEVTLKASADYESKASYDIQIVSTDSAGNASAPQAVSVSVINLDEVAPSITSGATGSVDENATISTVVYTATADDSADASGGLSFSLQGTDAALFDINASTGEVTLKASADQETKSSYDISIVATDNAGYSSAPHAVTITVNDLDEVAPTLTSGATGSVDENALTSTVVYTATADDSADISGGVTFGLQGTDAALFDINASTGEVTLKASADHEVKSSYDFDVVATDNAGNASTPHAVTITVNDLDEVAPTVTSGGTGSVDENALTSTVVYSATANDSADVSDGVTFSLQGTDAALFDINASTGEVTLKASADQEVKSSYDFDVVATDNAGNASTPQAVTITVNDLDEIGPTVTSGAAGSVDENAITSTIVYTATADDSADVSGGVTFSLQGTDASLFDINGTTGEVTLKASADHETKASYSFDVVATDDAGNASTPQAVTITVNDLDEVAPTVTSGGTGSVDENAIISTVVYTAIADDSADISGGVSFSLQGADAAMFDINASTGEVTLKVSADHEIASSYNFDVVATDNAGNASAPQSVTITVNDLDDTAPVITSGSTGSIDENALTSTVVYTVTADDTADVSAGVSFSLQGTDAALFDINASTGEVTLKSSADHEVKSSYDFDVVATDIAGNASTPQAVTITVNDLDEVAPTVTSGAAGSVDENSDISTVVYTVTSDDSGDVTGGVSYSLQGTDAALFNINSTSGEVTLKSEANFETKATYSIEVVATDNAGNASTPQAVTISVNDVVDEVAPTVTSPGTGSVPENALTSTVVYTATADEAATFALTGVDSALFDINTSSGEVTLKASADYEDLTSYSFSVVATDPTGNESTPHAVTISVTNVDDTTPVITSGAAGAVDENALTSTVIYTVVADDSSDVSGGITYSLTGTDAALLNINSSNGEVTLKASADQEVKDTYSFNVVADDGLTTPGVQAVTVNVNDLDEVAPTVTSGAAGTIDENASTPTVAYTAVADDSADISGGVTYTLQGTDAALFDINASTGEVTLKSAADHESKSSYDIEIVATDAAGNASSPQAVTISVNDLDEAAPTVTSAAVASIDENAVTSTVIYTATADDSADISGGVTFSLQGTDASLFDINSSNGEVTLKASADHEVKASYDIEIVATDNAGNASAPQIVTVTVNDLDDSTPTITSGATGSVAENAVNSTVVYTVTADDSGDISGGVTFSIQGTDAALFDINASTGDVTLKASADHEVKSSYDFEVVATDAAGNASPAQAVTVTVQDVDESAPTITSGATGTVVENALASTVVYTATSDDSGDISGGVTYTVQGTDAALFDINASTGAVTLKAPADYETKTSYDIEVVGTDAAGNASFPHAVTITVTDIDDTAPTITSGGTAYVEENTDAAEVVYRATADEAATFALSGADAAMFNINVTTGEVTLKASADFEVKASYDFTIVATDGAGNDSIAQPVTLTVGDIADEIAPNMTSADTASVDENVSTSTVVYTATADEAATFTLTGTDAGQFNINSSTGEVTLKSTPDYELQTSYDFNVVATDASGNASTELAVTLTINDLDDTAPVVTANVTANVDENAPISTVIYTAGADESATFSLQGTDAAFFNINSSNGEVTLKASADFEAKPVYVVEIIATDGSGNASNPLELTVNVNDLDDVAPTLTSGATGSVDENAVTSTVVYTATADETAVYSLQGTDAALFNINPLSGEVTLKASPDFEDKSVYDIQLVATDLAGNASSPLNVTISVNNLDELAPVITSGSTASVDENADPSTVVYTATADEPATFALAGPDAPKFNIDTNTGVITLKASADYETKASYDIAIMATSLSGYGSMPLAVTITVNDIDDSAPVFSSGATGSVDENADISTVVYTATTDEPATFALSGTDAALFDINASTGQVTLKASADFETKASYDINIVATDSNSNVSAPHAVTITINDVDEVDPNVTSGAVGSVDENAAISTVIYTATADEAVTFAVTGTDAALLDINASTGEVTLKVSADHEAKTSYEFDVVATDGAGNVSEPESVTVTVNDLDESAPSISSPPMGFVTENSPVSTVVYIASASDFGDVSGGFTWSLAGADAALLDINASTGEVTLKAEADYETKTTYNFDVVATDAALNSDSQSVTVSVNDIPNEVLEVVFAYNSSTALVNDDGDTTFDAGQSYDITIIVPSDNWQLWSTSFDQWSGAANLGSDDKITLVGASGYIQDNTSGSLSTSNMQRDSSSGALRWAGSSGQAIVLSSDGVLTRYTSSGGNNTIDLWSDSMSTLPQMDIQTDIPAEWGFIA